MEDAIIRANGLTKDYGHGRGVFGLDLAVKRGEVFGYVARTAPAKPPPSATSWASSNPTRAARRSWEWTRGAIPRAS